MVAEATPLVPEAPAGCSRCGGKGFTRRQRDGYDYIVKCGCRRPAEMAAAMADVGIPDDFHRTTLDPYPDDGRRPFPADAERDPAQYRAYEACRAARDRYLAHFLAGEPVADLHGLLLYGPSGRGKTRLMAALLGDLIHAGLRDVGFLGYQTLFQRVRQSYRKKGGYERLFTPLVTAKVLAIDDFAVDVSDRVVWVQDNIGYIINERYVRNLPTLLTASAWRPIGKAPHDHEDRADSPFIGYRLRSRIAEMCYELPIPAIAPGKRRIARGRS